MARLRIILGTMSIGGTLNETQSHRMIQEFVNNGFDEVDTAILYQKGNTEKIMGKSPLCRDLEKVNVACKVNKRIGLSHEKVVDQLNTSLKNLQRSSCDILYLHSPDHDVPIEETLKGVHQLHQEGKFTEFGLSNYTAWQVADIYHICKNKGYVLPTVYQGMYNALTRDIEMELIPSLRRFGIRFYVYNPLAGGLLTGRYDFSKSKEEQPGGRFFYNPNGGEFTNANTNVYQERFWRPSYRQGVDDVKKIVQATYGNDVTLLEASMRWLRHHSLLQDDDGIIIGCSKPEYLEDNLSAFSYIGSLHTDVVNAFDTAWNGIKSQCPKYYR